jgi:hypothetical protein
VDVAVRDAFGGDAALLLGGGGKPFHENVDRLFHIAVGGGERLFGIHHARAGAAAKLHEVLCGEIHGYPSRHEI